MSSSRTSRPSTSSSSKRTAEPVLVVDDSSDEEPVRSTRRPMKRSRLDTINLVSEDEETVRPSLKKPATVKDRADSDESSFSLDSPRANNAQAYGSVTCSIFKKLCQDVLEGDRFQHVADYLTANSVAGTWSFVNGLIQSNPNLKRVVDGKLWNDKPALLAIGGNVHRPVKGWYADIVTAEADDDYLKKYVGQSDEMNQRIRAHKSELKYGRSLHHKIAGAPGRKTNFVFLGAHTDAAKVPFDNALLDLVEMYFTLLLQSLQVKTLQRWLPHDVALLGDDGLNIALPLHQNSGDKKALFREMNDARQSGDPEVAAVIPNLTAEQAAKGRQTTAARNFVPVSQGLRAVSKKTDIRAPQNQWERDVRIKCSKCGTEKVDPDPVYTISADEYVTRQQYCKTCPPKSLNEKTGVPHYANPIHHPIDGRAKRSWQKTK